MSNTTTEEHLKDIGYMFDNLGMDGYLLFIEDKDKGYRADLPVDISMIAAV